MDVRLGALRLYRKHLVDQYADRCSFWCLKDISCEQMSRTITISTDGADQATWEHLIYASERCFSDIYFLMLMVRFLLSSILGFFHSLNILCVYLYVVPSSGQISNTKRPSTALIIQSKQTSASQTQNPWSLVFWSHITAGNFRGEHVPRQCYGPRAAADYVGSSDAAMPGFRSAQP